MGKIYSCYNTLHLESQRSDTLLSVITDILVCPVRRPSCRPRPPATTPRTCSANCQADFEVGTSALFVHLKWPKSWPGTHSWPFQSHVRIWPLGSRLRFSTIVCSTHYRTMSWTVFWTYSWPWLPSSMSPMRRRGLGTWARRDHERATSRAVEMLATAESTSPISMTLLHSSRRKYSSRYYQMSRNLFLKIMQGVRDYDSFFICKPYATDKLSFASYKKCSAAMCMLVGDLIDEYLRISETTCLDSISFAKPRLQFLARFI
jgi:hypothetical protein